MKINLYSLGFGTVLASLALAGCGGTDSGVGVNTTNANRALNSNTAVVVNSNGNDGIISTTNTNTSNTNRWANANSVTREEYNARRAEYEADRGNSKIGQGVNDSWIWFKTRAALLTTDNLRESTINVDVENNVVTLRGTVANVAQKTAAEKVAKSIEGVTRVQNQLQVRAEDSMTNQMTNSSGGNANANRGNANR
jgi:Predicted periplasmic or secreted lipoprotein